MKIIKKIRRKVQEYGEKLEEKLQNSLNKSHGITIAEPGKIFNNRYEYAESFGGGIELDEGSQIRAGMMKNDETYMSINALDKGKMRVFSEKGAVKCDGKWAIECDTILRYRGNPAYNEARSFYFNDGKDTGIIRIFTPTMYGGKPKDVGLGDRIWERENLLGEDSKYRLQKLDPLIDAMEFELGRTLIKRDKSQEKILK